MLLEISEDWMLNRIELKEKAKGIAFGNLGKIWLGLFVFILITAIASGIGEAFFPNAKAMPYIFGALVAWLTLGHNQYILSIIRGLEFTIKDMLMYGEYILDGIVLYFGIMITAILIMSGFIIVGGIIAVIIWPISYPISIFILVIAALSASIMVTRIAMINYIKADEPTKNVMDALKQSNEMMKGHINEFLMLNLSFIGWWLLSMITFGIALIWTVPYIAVANAIYYDELKKLN